MVVSTIQKIIITGGPGSGKTAVIESLKSKGYEVIVEAASELISEGEQDEVSAGDVKSFTHQVIVRQRKNEKECCKVDGGVVFLDGSLVESVAYLRNAGIPLPGELGKHIERANYDRAFFLELLPSEQEIKNHSDRARRLEVQESKKVHSLIKKAYQEFKIPIVSVPVLSVEERVMFVEKHISS